MKPLSNYVASNSKPVGFQNSFERFLGQTESKEQIRPLLSSNIQAKESKMLSVMKDSPTEKKNSECAEIGESSLYINGEVPPSIQNVVTSALEELEDNSIYFIPAEALPGCLNSLEICSPNNDALTEPNSPLSKSSKASVSSLTSLSESSNLTADDTKMEVSSEFQAQNPHENFSSANIIKNEPKVVVEMTPTYTSNLVNIPCLKMVSDSDDQMSDESDIIPVKSGKSCADVGEFVSISSPSILGESDPQDESKAVPSELEEADKKQSNVIKIRRRFRCPPSWKCEHKEGSTICSFKIEKPECSGEDNTEGIGMEHPYSSRPSCAFSESGEKCQPHASNYQKRSHLKNGEYVDKIIKKRRTDLDFEIVPGQGQKIGDIPCIAAEIDDSDEDQLFILHKILFDVCGSNRSKRAISKTKRNIFSFSGFPFTRDSNSYKHKRVRLNRLHSEMLREISGILFGSSAFQRAELSDKIMDFLMMPDGNKALQERLSKKYKRKHEIEKKENERTIKSMLDGKSPVATVLLQRMTEEEINKYICPLRLDPTNGLEQNCEGLDRPDDGSSQKRCVDFADSSAVKKMKRVPGNDNEYPKYLDALIQKSAPKCLVKETTSIGISENHSNSEVAGQSRHMQDQGFSIPSPEQSTSRSIRGDNIQKPFTNVLSSLASTGKHMVDLVRAVMAVDKDKNTENGELERHSIHSPQEAMKKQKMLLDRIENCFQDMCDFLRCDDKHTVSSQTCKALESPSSSSQKDEIPLLESSALSEPVGKPLRSFEKISSNVECATPGYLSALHDLIYSGPCDDLQIHKRILDFNGFPFKESSLDYRWRKTLLCHMADSTVEDISKLLDLSTNHQHKEEMCTSILQFLLKPDDSKL